MEEIVLCTIANAFRTYLTKRFIDTLAGKSRLGKKGEFFAYAVFFFATLGVYLAFHTTLFNFIANFSGMFILVSFYDKKLLENLFISGVVYIGLAVCDIIVVFIFVDYVDGESFNQVVQVIELFPMLMCELLAEKLLGRQRDGDVVQSYPQILVPACSIVMLILLVVFDADQLFIAITGVGLLVIDFFLLYLYSALCEAMEQKHENEMLRQQMEAYKNQLDVIQQSEKRVRILKHDLKHHMSELQCLAEKNDVKEITDYLAKMQDSLQNPNEFVSTGNGQTDSVLNYLLRKAREKGFDVHARVRIPDSINHSFNLNIILGNLLENAIEAGEKTEEKRLDVLISAKQGVLHIEVGNSYPGKETLREGSEKGTYLTTKEEKENHGIGLSSIQRIVEENHGSMEVLPEEKFLKIKIILYFNY